MEWQKFTSPRVLIVEDSEPQLVGIKNDLEAIPINRRHELGINQFVSHLAGSVDEAEALFSKSNGSPYDLLLLDLGIPLREGEPDNPENGQELLKKARSKELAKQVIVISIWFEVKQVLEAFRGGAVDFLAKPFKTEMLQEQVIKCWKGLLLQESTYLLGTARISELIQYAEKGLAHRFTAAFSSLVRTAAHTSEDIERYIRERYGLDRRKDSEDFFFNCLNTQEASNTKTKREWAALTAALQSPDESSRTETVENLLNTAHQTLLPCLIVKNLTLDFTDGGTSRILTFEDDVQAVLKEIIAGAAGKLQDFNETKRLIEIKAENAEGQVVVRCGDLLEPISVEDAKQINEGSSISPQRRFDREWGLSVVQHIAMRGGGRLEIDPQLTGNIITYFIPSAG